MPLWREYCSPVTVDEAMAALARAQGRARIIAGGTDLLLDLQQGRLPPPEVLVDVTRIDELTAITAAGGCLTIGAAVTHAQIAGHALLQRHAVCLVQASGLIGGPQVRNVATVGGNVAHALPAGDASIALLALEAEAEIASPQGRRWEPLESLFSGPGQPGFDRSSELLVSFRFRPCGERETSSFRRVMRPQGVAIAIMNMAAWLRWAAGGRVEDVRLAVGAAGPRPLRARQAEAALRGRPLEPDVIRAACAALESEARLRTSPHRATAGYRHALLGVLLKDVLEAASLAALEHA